MLWWEMGLAMRAFSYSRFFGASMGVGIECGLLVDEKGR